MRILVIGSKGLIGSHLFRELKDSGHIVSGMDIKNGPAEDATDSVCVYSVIEKSMPDAVVHLAVNIGPRDADDDVTQTVLDHVGMTAVVAQACGDIGVRLVYGSDDEVYGGGPSVEIQTPVRRHGLYGLSKRFGEEVGDLYAPDGFTALRFSMPYGPGAPPGSCAIVDMLWQAFHEKAIPVQLGVERSWCWIDDAVRAARIAIERGEGPYNIGRDDELFPMLTVAEIACVLTGAEQNLIIPVEAPRGQTLVKETMSRKIRSLGWEPKVSLYDGMKMTLESWVRQLDEAGAPVGNLRVVS